MSRLIGINWTALILGAIGNVFIVIVLDVTYRKFICNFALLWCDDGRTVVWIESLANIFSLCISWIRATSIALA